MQTEEEKQKFEEQKFQERLAQSEIERADHQLWVQTAEFRLQRLLHNFAFDITQTVQEMQDLIDILQSEYPELMCFDKTTLFLQQMRIVKLETDELKSHSLPLGNILQRLTLQKLREKENKSASL